MRLTFFGLLTPLALIGRWKYQGVSGVIIYKINAAFRSDLSLVLKPVVISLSKQVGQTPKQGSSPS